MIFLGSRRPEAHLRTYLLRYPNRRAHVVKSVGDDSGNGAAVFVGEKVAVEHFVVSLVPFLTSWNLPTKSLETGRSSYF